MSKRGVRSFSRVDPSKRNDMKRDDLIHKFPHLPKETRTFGQKLADKLTNVGGSWAFIFTFLILIFLWMLLNVAKITFHWDPYPYILLNLVLSCLAAIQAPIILMSQKRAAQRDRRDMKYDYQVNRKAERENVVMMQDLREIKEILKTLKKK